ncbi:MAG: hypothetical protein L0228_11590 [Planctomycetes bacterium]|nr:hypothetical protein [Planctomycetota bacterium]
MMKETITRDGGVESIGGAAAEAASPQGHVTSKIRFIVEPFRIICETCRARLKVSSASVVGEIHACPKCGSMVQIRPPVDGQAAPPSSINSASIEIGVPAVPSFDDVAITSLPTTRIEFIEPPAPVAPVASGSPSLLLWGIGGATILAVGGLLTAVWYGGETTAVQPAPVAEALAGDTSETDADIESIETKHDKPPDEPPVDQPDPYSVASNATTAETSPSISTLPELLPVESKPTVGNQQPAVAAVTDTSAAPAVATSEVPQATAPPAEKPPAATPVMKFDPLDFDPSQLSFSTNEPTAASPDSSSVPANAEVVVEGPDDDAEAGDAVAPPPPASAADRSLTVRLGPMPSGDAPLQRTAEQLGMRLDSLAVTDVRLSRFVELVSELTDVGVTLDPVELELAGISPRQAVSVDVKAVTIEQILRDLLKKHRLDFVERDGHAGIALAGGDRRREVVYDVADLAGAADAKAIAELVARFVAPTTWTAAGGAGSIRADGTKLRIEQTQSVRHQVLIFVERLRLARGLPLRSRYPASLLSVQSPYEALAQKLKQHTTFTFLPWTRLTDVLRHWQESSQLTILVDWSAAADVELGPSSPVSCSAIDRSWDDVFDEVLAPLGLGWWAINGEAIQITSREKLDEIQRIEFHAVPKPIRGQFAGDAALVESLQTELAELDAGSHAKSQPPVVELDEPGGRLIVLGTPRIHRHLTQRLGGDAKHVVSRNP